MAESYHPLRVFCGSAHPALAGEIAKLLGVPLGKTTTTPPAGQRNLCHHR